MRNQGRDENSGWLRHVRLGYNYRLCDLHCALGVAQLERIDELLSARDRVAEAYSRGLSHVPESSVPYERKQSEAGSSMRFGLKGASGPAARSLMPDFVSAASVARHIFRRFTNNLSLRNSACGSKTYFQYRGGSALYCVAVFPCDDDASE